MSVALACACLHVPTPTHIHMQTHTQTHTHTKFGPCISFKLWPLHFPEHSDASFVCFYRENEFLRVLSDALKVNVLRLHGFQPLKPFWLVGVRPQQTCRFLNGTIIREEQGNTLVLVACCCDHLFHDSSGVVETRSDSCVK
jgi:hypothetical protein